MIRTTEFKLTKLDHQSQSKPNEIKRKKTIMVDRNLNRNLNMHNFIPIIGELVRIEPPQGPRDLPDTYQPSKWSVICGRGREPIEHVGNRRLRVLVACHISKYENATTKMQRTLVVNSIIDAVQSGAEGTGGFVKKNPKTGRWFEVSDDLAREKVGRALREAIAATNPSRYQTKKVRRRLNNLLRSSQGKGSPTLETSLMRGELVQDEDLESIARSEINNIEPLVLSHESDPSEFFSSNKTI